MEPVNFDTRLSLGQLQSFSKAAANPSAEDVIPGKALDSFGQILKNHLDQVNQLEGFADQLAEDFAVGKPVDLHNVIIAHEKADLALEFTMQLRNKALAAYQSIGQMSM